jgi:lactate permease
MVIRDGKPMAAVFSFNILSAAGSAILFAALFSLPIMGANLATAGRVFVKTLKTLKFSILSVSFILGFAYIMNFSGMAITLGNAFVGTGPAFLFFSPFLGWLGVFMTGSDTSANALFGKLQEVTATKLGIDPVIAVAANTSGGGCGKMISPQSLSVATAATNQVGKEADIFRFTLKHSIVLTSIVAIVVFLQSNALFWLVPAYAKGSATAPGATVAPPLEEGVMYLLGNLALIAIVTVVSRMVGKKTVNESKEGPQNAAA